MYRPSLIGLAVALTFVALAAPAVAQKPDKPKDRDGQGVEATASVGFSVSERRVIAEYFAEAMGEAFAAGAPAERDGGALRPRYNVAPSQPVLTVVGGQKLVATLLQDRRDHASATGPARI